jgi:hypothetical protein
VQLQNNAFLGESLVGCEARYGEIPTDWSIEVKKKEVHWNASRGWIKETEKT